MTIERADRLYAIARNAEARGEKEIAAKIKVLADTERLDDTGDLRQELDRKLANLRKLAKAEREFDDS